MPPLSQRGREGERGGRGLPHSPSPNGAVKKKAQIPRGRGSTEMWLDGWKLKSSFLSLPQRFCVAFVLHSHQQDQHHPMLEKARVTTSSKGLWF